jgi:hypothetical protein
LALTRHFSLISWMSRNVVNSLFAIISVRSRPAFRSFRRLDAVTPPQGKAILAATASRSGVSGPICAGSNDLTIASRNEVKATPVLGTHFTATLKKTLCV